MENKKMNTKNLLVSFLAVAIVLTLVVTVSAATNDLASSVKVKVDDTTVYNNGYDSSPVTTAAITAGDTIQVKVYFTSAVGNLISDNLENDGGTNVRVRAELQGEKVDVTDITDPFDVENGSTYVETLTLKVPYELRDQISDNIDLSLKIWNGDYKTQPDDITLRVQRPTYNADIKSVSVSNTVSAGDTFPVDIVVKNTGYNNLDDLYVTVSIDALGIKKSAYFGDLVVNEDPSNDKSTDTVNGRLYLTVPYDVKPGTYTVTVDASNDDTESTAVGQLVIENDFTNTAIASTTTKNAGVNEDATYNLLVVNPTDKLKVYTIVPEASGALTVSADQTVIAVPASSSQTVKITAKASEEGQYDFDVKVISGQATAETVPFSLNTQGASTGTTTATNPVIVLTIVLAIIFIVLLVVLIVLLGKKPEKTEEFGESYY